MTVPRCLAKPNLAMSVPFWKRRMNRRDFVKKVIVPSALLAGGYPLLWEPYMVRVNHYVVPIPDLPVTFDGFRLVHLSDIHLGFPLPDLFVERIVAKANDLKGDGVVCTGDYVNAHNSIEEIDRVWPILMKLRAKYGVFSVLGNHDHWADGKRSLYWLSRSGQSVRHSNRKIVRGRSRLVIGGAGDLWEDNLQIDAAFRDTDEKDCRILLAHNPDSVDTQFNTPLSLVLSGHTHGGQVSLPFYGPPLLPVTNKNYSHGLVGTEKAPLFVSRGIGWAIFPVRFNCYPEIAVLHLKKTETG